MIYQVTNKIVSLEVKHRRFGFTYKAYGDYELIKFSDKDWEIIKCKIYGHSNKISKNG